MYVGSIRGKGRFFVLQDRTGLQLAGTLLLHLTEATGLAPFATKPFFIDLDTFFDDMKFRDSTNDAPKFLILKPPKCGDTAQRAMAALPQVRAWGTSSGDPSLRRRPVERERLRRGVAKGR